ncbi:MAG: branched chain amino acid aminotransferase [Bacteroidia bacterium]|nr:MAG: branched chain amino acid aminotransferase [Bacteroidia bacterium]PIE86451.1 MAG: branched chain amino acid aminotransferase [Bacteroidia bacterium]
MKNIDWGKLTFSYSKTEYNVRCYYRDGKWGEIEISSSEKIDMHMAATCLHYGQEAFEGMKAYRGKDGKIRLFRWEENARRLRNSAKGVKMAEVPDELFKEMLFKVCKLNQDFIPPYGTGSSLYIRPLLIGTSAKVGLQPSDEYLFIIFVAPVGPYFKNGFKPTDVMITRKYDRAAPLGTGRFKVGGNYAAGVNADQDAHNAGYGTVMFLDAKEKKYIDEIGAANFFAVKGNTYVTPKSGSILPSITNLSLTTLAKDIGMTVERRPVPVEELAEFDEVGACGTAAVITPINRIVDHEVNVEYKYNEKPGKYTTQLYNKLLAIQYGDEPDEHNWVTILE